MKEFKFKTSTAREIRVTLSKLVNLVANNRISESQARTITYISSYILQSIRLDEQDIQIQELKEAIEQLEKEKANE